MKFGNGIEINLTRTIGTFGVICALGFGAYKIGPKIYSSLKDKEVVETVKYKEMTAQQKWDSLELEDKTYFIKKGILDLPEYTQEEVRKFQLDEILNNDKSISKTYKMGKYFKNKFTSDKEFLSKKDQQRNLKNLEYFLGGDIYGRKSN